MSAWLSAVSSYGMIMNKTISKHSNAKTDTIYVHDRQERPSYENEP